MDEELGKSGHWAAVVLSPQGRRIKVEEEEMRKANGGGEEEKMLLLLEVVPPVLFPLLFTFSSSSFPFSIQIAWH
jgi:hypothetical protein